MRWFKPRLPAEQYGNLVIELLDSFWNERLRLESIAVPEPMERSSMEDKQALSDFMEKTRSAGDRVSECSHNLGRLRDDLKRQKPPKELADIHAHLLEFLGAESIAASSFASQLALYFYGAASINLDIAFTPLGGSEGAYAKGVKAMEEGHAKRRDVVRWEEEAIQRLSQLHTELLRIKNQSPEAYSAFGGDVLLTQLDRWRDSSQKQSV